MGKVQIRIKDFFEGKRRKCSLTSFQVNRGKNEKHTVRLSIKMPLSDGPIDGIPDVFAEMFALMGREKSPQNFSKIDVAIESATFNIFTTDTTRRPIVESNAASLRSFRLVGEGVEDKRSVDLEFEAYLPGNEPIRDWCWDHLHKDFYVEVVPAQMELTEEKPAAGKKDKGKQMSLVN